MAEVLQITPNATKEDIYEEIIPQIKSLIEGEEDLIANLANTAAVLTQAFGFLWMGFYLLKGKRLVLGPFQGPIACTSIPLVPAPKGVCGAAVARQETIVVPDVDQFPGHIACSSLSRSEIVVPLIHDGVTQLVLDIDSTELNTFDGIDALYLEQIITILRQRHFETA